jgi:uncharacterized membrane protein YeaQ/YmgE (transglycosylase-associated protein family)
MNWTWRRSYSARVVLGLLVGAVVGFAIYGADHLTGATLFLVAGSIGGVVAALIVQFYGNSVRLTDITLTVPQFSELHFAVTRDSQQVAWKLFVESVTRISSQTLEGDEGLLREALTSIYGLFATTRDVLKEARPSTRTGTDPTVEHLAVAMLNNELRPFLSRWHPALKRWEDANPGQPESSWPEAQRCRDDLTAMQRRLREYILGFGGLAGLPNAREILDGTLGDFPR